MNEKLEKIKQELIRLIKAVENNDWSSSEIIIEFAPFTNKGYTTLPSFWNKEKNRLRLFLTYDDKFNKHLFNFIFLFNQDKTYNQLKFSTKKDFYDEAILIVSFNQTIEDRFQNNLPKSKRGKTLPWWKIDSEIIGLGNL